MKTLMDLSGMEAQELKFNYLKRLFSANIHRFSKTQKRITDCLDFYSCCLDWEHIYNTAQHRLVKEMARETLLIYAPIVRESEPLVNQWLAEGQPLELGTISH